MGVFSIETWEIGEEKKKTLANLKGRDTIARWAKKVTKLKLRLERPFFFNF